MEFKELFVIVVFILSTIISGVLYGVIEYFENKIRHNRFNHRNTKH